MTKLSSSGMHSNKCVQETSRFKHVNSGKHATHVMNMLDKNLLTNIFMQTYIESSGCQTTIGGGEKMYCTPKIIWIVHVKNCTPIDFQ